MTALYFLSDLPMAVSEDKRQYVLRVDLPGFARDQVAIQVEDGMLRILGASGTDCSSQARLMSTLNLPQDVEHCSVVADFRDGVLQVRLPRATRARSWWPC